MNHQPTSDEDAKLDRELKQLGCPYGCNDHRARIWLDGFQSATQHAADKLRRDLCGDLARDLAA